MTRVNSVYTMATWVVEPGNEHVFISEWKAFADWTVEHKPGAMVGYLLQDPQRPHQFVSFGPWESIDGLKSWRECPEYAAFLTRVRSLCTDFMPQVYTQVARAEKAKKELQQQRRE